jgi:uncharacterized membrane protein YoaK (UPF0700 family)
MFRHQGKSRKLKHNIGIAVFLSFVAGIVNVVGFLSVQKLTTNVTGHFAFMVEAALGADLFQLLFYLAYIAAFFTGAFFSSFLVEVMDRTGFQNRYLLPVLTEAAILLAVSFSHVGMMIHYPNEVACTLLFAMGLQNALVTRISNSVVRTTHLTGLFTDLGIEIAQLCFEKSKDKRMRLLTSVKLRFIIVSFFFAGGVISGILFRYHTIRSLLLAPVVLITGLAIDYILLSRRRLHLLRNKH